MTTPSRLATRTRVPTPPEPRKRIVLGRVDRIDDAYARNLRVPTGMLVLVLAGATVVDLVALLLAAIFRVKAPVASRPGFRALRKGPEFTVTPIWVRDADGSLVELEVHGYLGASAMIPTDRIRTTVYRQKGRDTIPRVGDLENLTTGRMVRPRRATLVTHFGVPLLLQAALGALLIIVPLALSLLG